MASPAFLAPFANRNYRLYFSGQLISITGTFVTFTALSWVGLGMVVYASSRTLGWALPSMFICGMGAVTFFTSANALVQDIVDESMRGRVMSWYLLSFQAGFPIGGLIIGATATRLGVNLSVLLWGLLTGGAVLFLAFNRNRLLVRSVEGLLKTHPN